MNSNRIETSRDRPAASIALATFNGERFIRPLLESISKQSFSDFEIVVSDDDSTDNTLHIIKQYTDILPIHILPAFGRLGVAKNFERAINFCRGQYVAPADQDDVWAPDKLHHIVARMRELESRLTDRTPLIVFSDLSIVDERLKILKASFYDATIKSARATSFCDYVLDNHIPGCAMLINRAALDIALPFPDVDMHDWWLALITSACGEIHHVPLPLIAYRQHSNNSIGLGSTEGTAPQKVASALLLPGPFLRKRARRWSRQAAAIRRNMVAVQKRLAEDSRAGAALRLAVRLNQGSYFDAHAALRASTPGVRTLDRCALIWLLTRRPLSNT